MTIILLRHAERVSTGADALSAAGRRRADLLARMFRKSGVAAIFTSEFIRTKQTAAPLAEAIGITPIELSGTASGNSGVLLGAGPVSVVIGHSDSVPELIAALGGPAGLEIDENEFDRLFVLTVTAGAASLLEFRYVSV
jgi:phosphohistidine phosphatase SixA